MRSSKRLSAPHRSGPEVAGMCKLCGIRRKRAASCYPMSAFGGDGNPNASKPPSRVTTRTQLRLSRCSKSLSNSQRTSVPRTTAAKRRVFQTRRCLLRRPRGERKRPRSHGRTQASCFAHELVTSIKGSVTVDWMHRDAARARMRILVKKILRKYGFPPDLQDAAVQTVLQQAEALSAEWAAG